MLNRSEHWINEFSQLSSGIFYLILSLALSFIRSFLAKEREHGFIVGLQMRQLVNPLPFPSS